MTEFKISIAKAEDIELLVRHRVGMWKDIRPEFAEKAKEMEDLTRRWIKTKLSEGKLIGFIAKTQTGDGGWKRMHLASRRRAATLQSALRGALSYVNVHGRRF